MNVFQQYRFHRLMTRYKELVENGRGDTEEARTVFMEVLSVAPPEFTKMVEDTAKEFGLLPDKPDAYTDAGEPLYNISKITSRLGIDEKDVPEDILRGAYRGPRHSIT